MRDSTGGRYRSLYFAVAVVTSAGSVAMAGSAIAPGYLKMPSAACAGVDVDRLGWASRSRKSIAGQASRSRKSIAGQASP